jgi:hypothetical protein
VRYDTQSGLQRYLTPPETATSMPAGAHEIHFSIERQARDGEAARTLTEKSTFVLPR